MDLSTRYLGLDLPHPLMPGASPMVDDLDMVRRLEDAGAAAICMHSLFEEQIVLDRFSVDRSLGEPAESFAEALSYFPSANDYALGPDAYLEQVRRVKEAVSVPVIGSLNGITPAGWIDNAVLIQEAGADALEINVYLVAADPDDTAEEVENRVVAIARDVRDAVTIPVAVKLSPYFTAVPHLVRRLGSVGVDGYVLFNRFYQPDIDIEELEVRPGLELSTPSELRLRLRWLAILADRVQGSLAVSGGVHWVEDVVKAVMAGADAVQMVSSLFLHGPEHLTTLRSGLERWLIEHEYDDLAQMRGSMSLRRSPSPAAFERGNYLKVLQSWRREFLPAAE